MLVGGVLDAAVVQVMVEPSLEDGVDRAQPHRHRGEFPEIGHQPRVRIGRDAAAGMAVLLAEAVELVGGQAALQERPGVDAVRAQYFFKNTAVLELAHSCTGNNNRTITALKYAFNTWNYDMQFITGWYQDHLTVGAGWAGNIKDAGFKGEWQYFFRGKDSAGHLNISLEGDYMFPKGWYLNGSLLFNSLGLYTRVSNWNNINLKLSAENPMPTRWNALITASKEITPLFSASLGVLYAPGTRLLILLPTLQYNMATNLDLSLVWQSFFAEIDSRFGSVSNICNLRLKWSY